MDVSTSALKGKLSRVIVSTSLDGGGQSIFFEKLFDVDPRSASSRAALMGGTKATTSSFQSIGAA